MAALLEHRDGAEALSWLLEFIATKTAIAASTVEHAHDLITQPFKHAREAGK